MTDRMRLKFTNGILVTRSDPSVAKSMLLKHEIDPNARLPCVNDPPALVLAAWFGRDDLVELLLNDGARIDDVDNAGQSACHAAARGNHTEVMCLLLSHRPNLALKDNEGNTAFQTAIHFFFIMCRRRNNNENVLMQLIRAGVSLDGLSRAELCKFAATSTVAIQMLMDRNIVVSDLCGEFDRTPLHWAARMDPIARGVVSMLVDCGVDLEARDNEQNTCTDTAAGANNVDALRLFLLAGANVDTDVLLLHKSVRSSNRNVMCMLLAAGADVAARDRLGQTACHRAAAESHEKMPFVHAMLAAGADLDAEDDDGQTPRHCLAAQEAFFEPEQVELARREIAKMRLDFVRHRAMEICIGLQSLQLDALQLCEILQHSCGPRAHLNAFHQWWKIATTVKHFKHEF
jgi:ankyrin repeat protein